MFSAVVTSFLIDAYKRLQPSDIALRDLIRLVRDADLDIPDPDPIMASDVAINVVWFLSLVTSLATAFLCIIIKQWLFERTTPDKADSTLLWVLLRQAGFDGLDKWRVGLFVAVLPLALHAALFMFMTGLVIFLWPLLFPLAVVVACIAAALFLVYVFSLMAPIVWKGCPYKTSLHSWIERFAAYVGALLFHLPENGGQTQSKAEKSRLQGRALHWLAASESDEVFNHAVWALGAAKFDPELVGSASGICRRRALPMDTDDNVVRSVHALYALYKTNADSSAALQVLFQAASCIPNGFSAEKQSQYDVWHREATRQSSCSRSGTPVFSL